MKTHNITLLYKHLILFTCILTSIALMSCSDQIATDDDDNLISGEDSLFYEGKAGPAQNLMVWGDNSFGQISDAPKQRLRAIDGGSSNGLAIGWNGTPLLWGTTLINPPSIPPGPLGTPPLPEELKNEKFRAISLGRNDAVLIRLNHTLAAFGHNPPVVNVPTGKYRAVAAAVLHAIAIAQDGTLMAWGNDSYTDLSTNPPLIITGLLNAPKGGPFNEISARSLYSIALHGDGTIYGWGYATNQSNDYNIFGTWIPTPNDPKIFYVPNQKFKAIAAGNVHVLAIRKNGTIMGWGNNATGALQAPTHVRFKAIAAGFGFSVGLSTDGTLWGWGTPIWIPNLTSEWTFATQGWMRFGNTEYYYIPNERFKSIAASPFNVLALKAGR